MYATHRRYEGIDQSRIEELTRKVNVSLIPRLSELPGFKGYYLMEAGDGVVRSTSLFDTSSQAKDSNRIAAEWTQEEKLAELVSNPPKVMSRRCSRTRRRRRHSSEAPARRHKEKARTR